MILLVNNSSQRLGCWDSDGKLDLNIKLSNRILIGFHWQHCFLYLICSILVFSFSYLLKVVYGIASIKLRALRLVCRTNLNTELFVSTSILTNNTSMIPTTSKSTTTEIHTKAEILLLVYIHGFKGTEETFNEFPERLEHMLSETIPDHVTVESRVFPAYEVWIHMAQSYSTPPNNSVTD